MTADQTGDEAHWLVEPPEPNEVQFHISVGEGIEVSDEVRQAIDSLVQSLLSSEMEGYTFGAGPNCPDLQACGTFNCLPLRNCQPLTKKPKCLADVRCFIMPP